MVAFGFGVRLTTPVLVPLVVVDIPVFCVVDEIDALLIGSRFFTRNELLFCTPNDGLGIPDFKFVFLLNIITKIITTKRNNFFLSILWSICYIFPPLN